MVGEITVTDRAAEKIEMCEFDAGVERSKYYYEAKTLAPVPHAYVTTVAEKQRLEGKQLELYEIEP